MTQELSTGSGLLPLTELFASPTFDDLWDTLIVNPPDPVRRELMFKKIKLELQARNFSLVFPQRARTMTRIGTSCGKLAQLGISCRFPPIYVFNITSKSQRLLQTLRSLLRSLDSATFFGARLLLESRDWPGSRHPTTVYNLTLKTPTPSGGAATALTLAASLMSFEDSYPSLTYYDGWTDILSSWKPKGELVPSWHILSGLPATSIPEIGIPTLTMQPNPLYYED